MDMNHIFVSHYGDVIMGAIASQITSFTIVYSTVYSDADQGKHQSSASVAFVRWIHRGPVNSPHKWPVTRKMFPFEDVIMEAGPCFNLVYQFGSSVSKQHDRNKSAIHTESAIFDKVYFNTSQYELWCITRLEWWLLGPSQYEDAILPV